MAASIVISIVTFVALTVSILFFPAIKIHSVKIGTYWIIALIGALLLIIFGLAPLGEIAKGLTAADEINPLKILALFFSMTFLSVFLDEMGLFRFLAQKAVTVAKTNQISLFLILYALTSLLTVFTSNDVVILTLTPFICFFCKNTKINPVPYLVGEFAAANTWSMMFIIGNPTNIYLATSAQIGFLEYFKVMALPTLAAGAVELGMILLIFSRQLKTALQPQPSDATVENKVYLAVGLIHMAICLVFLVISGYIHVEMWLVSAVCATSLLLFIVAAQLIKRNGKNYFFSSVKRLPWQLIPFVLSMFVIVICLNYQGVSKEIGALLGDKMPVWKYGAASFLSANLINNIPMSMLFSTLPVSLPPTNYLQAIYATIVGSNIGAFLTPIGALAGIMFTDLTEKYQVDYGFKQFIKYGTVISVPTLASVLLVLAFVL